MDDVEEKYTCGFSSVFKSGSDWWKSVSVMWLYSPQTVPGGVFQLSNDKQIGYFLIFPGF